MTEQLKPCPTSDCTGLVVVMNFRDPKYPEQKLLRVTCSCGWSGPMSDDRALAYAAWNTRPSASREIAVKKLEWKHRKPPAEDIDNLFGEVCRAETLWDDPYIIYDDSLCDDGGYIDDESDTIWFYGNEFHQSVDAAKAAAQADYERRILSAIDTTPGNTDPIAKYDDELRKVQGRVQPDWEGFGRAITEDWPTSDIDGSDLFHMSLKYGLIAEIPGGYNPDEHIDSEGICPERGDPWYEYTFRSAPTEHPTEQPSVEEAARVLLANTPNPIFDDLKGVMMGEFYWTREISDENGDGATEKLYVPWTTIKEIILAALRSLAQEGE